MTNLTEKWKKGELQAGRYYIRLTPDYEKPLETNDYFLGVDFELTDNDSVDEVLAPVPSYEEWQAKLDENTKLKELLDDCRIELDYWGDKDCQNLIVRINKVLGEE